MSTEFNWQDLLDDLLELDEGLSDWEVQFIEDLNRRRNAGYSLTAGQKKKLAEIWEARAA